MGKQSQFVLAFLALGVVFGDIGTSPLYALKETFFGHYKITPDYINVLGALSLFFWALAIIITFKYVFLITKADNDGEGGIFALLGLIKQNYLKIPNRLYAITTLLVLFGAGLLYGDGMITPAISVISAVEGIEIVTPALANWVVPLTIIILFILFAVQKRGTSGVAALFSPVMTVWFLALVGLAIPYLIRNPSVFWAVNPIFGVKFLVYHGFGSVWILGAVVLCITGGEALYADLGHFGRGAIAKAWTFFVYPSLLINYFGQGARLLEAEPIVNNNLFYSLVPDWALWPMVALSTLATVIASQALISGSYSLTHQAMGLGVFPRVKILHTNPDVKGQIYLPFVNWVLFAGTVLLVIFFKSTTNIAAAYGIAVTGTMAITTVAFYVVARYYWRWPVFRTILVCAILILIDLAFFGANLLKFFQGGYVPLLVGLILFAIMWLWRWGRRVIADAHRVYGNEHKMSWLIELKTRLDWERGTIKDSRPRKLVESDRVVVFMSSHPVIDADDGIPASVRVYLKRNGVFPRHAIILTVVQEKMPYVTGERYEITDFGHGLLSIRIRYGFMENPDVKEMLRELKSKKVIEDNLHRCTIEVGEEDIYVRGGTGFKNRILANIFESLYKIATPAHVYFGLRDASGIDKIVIPIVVDKEGVRIDIPEFAFSAKEEEQAIDPDTLQPSEVEFTKIE